MKIYFIFIDVNFISLMVFLFLIC